MTGTGPVRVCVGREGGGGGGRKDTREQLRGAGAGLVSIQLSS
jgi:hypothetical protein